MTNETPAQNQCGCPEPGTTNVPKASASALWSMICGIAGILLCLPALPAIILGIVGLVNIKKSAGALTGSGKAITGIVLGGLAILVWPFILIVASISFPAFMHARGAAMEMKTRAEIINIGTALEQYRADYGDYPSTEQGFQMLISNDQGQKYLDKIPDDSWGRPYHYRYPGTYNSGSFDLWSDGKDGIEGTIDDVNNWKY